MNNTVSNSTITLTDDDNNVVLTTTTGALITDSSGYLTSNTFPSNHSHTITTSGYVYAHPTYSFTDEGEGKLVIRDQNGKECLALKDGKIYIGEQTLHQVILDVIDMVNGDKAITDLLVDPDQGKRELGKEIYERRSRKTTKKRTKTSSTNKE